MNEKALSSWFRKRRESSVLDAAKDHLLRILDTAREMDNAIKCAHAGNAADALAAIERVGVAEKVADNIEIRMEEELAKGDIPSKEREDIMHLVKRLDHIADWIKSASKNLQIIIEAKMAVSPEIWGKYRTITLKSVSATTALKAMLDSMGTSHSDVVRYATDIDRLEHEVDDDYFALKKDLMTSDLDPRVLFVLRDLLHALENSLDDVKTSSELIHIIITATE